MTPDELAEDQSYDDMINVFGNLLPEEPDETKDKSARKAVPRTFDFISTKSSDTDSLLHMMAKLVLRHEDLFAAINLDRAFLIHQQSGSESLTPLDIGGLPQVKPMEGRGLARFSSSENSWLSFSWSWAIESGQSKRPPRRRAARQTRQPADLDSRLPTELPLLGFRQQKPESWFHYSTPHGRASRIGG